MSLEIREKVPEMEWNKMEYKEESLLEPRKDSLNEWLDNSRVNPRRNPTRNPGGIQIGIPVGILEESRKKTLRKPGNNPWKKPVRILEQISRPLSNIGSSTCRNAGSYNKWIVPGRNYWSNPNSRVNYIGGIFKELTNWIPEEILVEILEEAREEPLQDPGTKHWRNSGSNL